MVLRHLPRQDLCSLCLVCKGLRALTEPFLYSRIFVPTPHYVHGNLLVPTNLQVAVRTLLARPDLRQHVRDVQVGAMMTNTDKRTFEAREALVPAMIQHLRTAESDTSIDETRLREGFFDDSLPRESVPGSRLAPSGSVPCSPNEVVAYILLHCPNLRTLRYRHQCHENHDSPLEQCFEGHESFGRLLYEDPLFGIIFRQAPKLGHLSRLTHVYFPTLEGNMSNVLSVLYLPGLRYLDAAIINPGVSWESWSEEKPPSFDLPWPGPEPPVALNLTSLHLSLLREGPLGSLLAATPHLTKLKWEWVANIGRISNTVADFDQIARDISVVKDTLQDLEIYTRVGPVDYFEDHGEIKLGLRGTLRGLSALTALKRLRLPRLFLFGSCEERPALEICEVLPKNIESVTISRDLHSHYEWRDSTLDEAIFSDALKRWLTVFPNHTPRFRALRIESPYTWYKQTCEALAELTRGVVGVELYVVAGKYRALRYRQDRDSGRGHFSGY